MPKHLTKEQIAYTREQVRNGRKKFEVAIELHIARDTVIVQGNSSSSKLLKKAIRISGYGKNHYFASGEFCKIIGKQRGYSLLRSSPRVIEGEFAQNLVQFMEIE